MNTCFHINPVTDRAKRLSDLLRANTGLAQVNQGYDTCIKDVRSGVGFDHRYALALGNPVSWLKMDPGIILWTLVVILTGRGQ